MTTPTSWSDHFLNARATPALGGGGHGVQSPDCRAMWVHHMSLQSPGSAETADATATVFRQCDSYLRDKQKFCHLNLLPVRVSEQGNVIGLVSVYIYIYIYSCHPKKM